MPHQELDYNILKGEIFAQRSLLRAIAATHPNPPLLLAAFERNVHQLTMRLDNTGDGELAGALTIAAEDLRKSIPVARGAQS